MYKRLTFNLARNSLRYLIKTYDIKELYLPYYLCDEIRHSVVKANCRPIFYHIDDDFMPVESFSENAFILYPNYFGICDENVKILRTKYKNLIVDNSHSFYSKPSGFASFNSARKFLPVYWGSYLWTEKVENLPEFVEDFEKITNFEQKELSFSKSEVRQILPDEIERFANENEVERRAKKFVELHKKYKNLNLLKIKPCRSPFCYPLLMQDEESADKLVKEFEEKGATIYRYWRELPKTYNEYKFYRCLIPIPLAD